MGLIDALWRLMRLRLGGKAQRAFSRKEAGVRASAPTCPGTFSEVNLAKQALIQKQQRKSKFKVRAYNRCRLCGRPRAFIRQYGICRICFRELAHKGQVPGVTKASW